MWQHLIVKEYRDGYGYHLRDFLNDVGYLAICTPGTVAGLFALLTAYGTRSWAACLVPALALARDGFTLTQGGRPLLGHAGGRPAAPHDAGHGHSVLKSPAAYWAFPLVHAIAIDPHVDGGADPRGEGMAVFA